MIQKTLGRLPELTVKHILHQTGNSNRRLAKLLERLKELKEINGDSEVQELIPVAASHLAAISR